MKILAGFKDVAQGQQVCRLIRGLDFPLLQLRMTHVLDVWGSGISGIEPSPFNYESYLKHVEAYAELSLKGLQEQAEKMGLSDVSRGLLYGNPVNELLDYAEAHDYEILALGSSDQGNWQAFVAGGVVRKAIANSKKSLLIAKGADSAQDELSIVLATDHSPYANRWIDRFISWSPRGIKDLTLLTVLPTKFLDPLPSSQGHMDVSNWIRDGLAEENKRVLEKLQVLGAQCHSVVATGDVNEVLAKTMQHSQSSLLVLGSQGHGFKERLTIGSVALEQAIKRPYSVLIVRE